MKPRPTLREHLKNVARMRRPAAQCLDEQQAVAFYSGTLSREEADGVRDHLADCPACLDLARDARQFLEIMSGAADVPATQIVGEPANRASGWSQLSTRRSWLQTLRASLRASPAFAFSVVAAIALVAGSAFLIARAFSLQNQLHDIKAAQGEKERQLQEVVHELERERARVEQLTAELQGRTAPVPQPDKEPARVAGQRQPDQKAREPQLDQAHIAAFVLTPSLVRDPAQNKPFELSTSASLVELHVGLGPDGHKSYRAVLRTADGEQKWTRAGMKAQTTTSGKRLLIVIPAGLFDKRDYVLKLIGVTHKGDQEELDQYPFSVVKK